MSTKKIQFLAAGALVGFACVANAQNLTGILDVNDQAPETGFFTSSSLSLDVANVVSPFPGGETGSFLSLVPAGSEVTGDSAVISGLSATTVTENISDFLVFASQGPFISGTGTTPSDRFSFDLTSLSETYNASTGLANFVGVGTIVDDQGVYANTAADLFLGFSGPNTYSFTLQAVPEPGTLTLLVAGLGMIPLLRRKKS